MYAHILEALNILDDNYHEANPEDEFGNFLHHTFRTNSIGDYEIAALFYYSGKVTILEANSQVWPLERAIADILHGTSDLIGYDFQEEINDIHKMEALQ